MKLCKWHILSLFVVLFGGCGLREDFSSASRVPFMQEPLSGELDTLIGRMTLEEKVGQLIFLEYQSTDSIPDSVLLVWAREGILGGILPEGLSYPEYRAITDTLQRTSQLPLFVASRNRQMLHQQFRDWKSPYTFTRIGNDSLRGHLQRLYAREAYFLGVNMVFGIDLESNLEADYWNEGRTEWLNAYHILSGTEQFDDYYPHLDDTSTWLQEVLQPTADLIGHGLSAVTVSSGWQEYCGSENASFQTYFAERLQFDGLLWAKVNAFMDLICLWEQGIDQFWVSGSPESVHRVLLAAVKNGVIQEEELDKRVQHVLRAKDWMHNGLDAQKGNTGGRTALTASLLSFSAPDAYSKLERERMLADHFDPLLWEAFHHNLDMASLVLLHHPRGKWPMVEPNENPLFIIDYSPQPAVHLRKTLREYLEPGYRHAKFTPGSGYHLPVIPEGHRPVVILEGTYLRYPRDTAFLEAIRSRHPILINMGPPEAIAPIDTAGFTLIQAPGRTRYIEEALAEVLVGARTIDGKLTNDINNQLRMGAGLSYSAIRLGNSSPEEVGIRGEKLVSIDAIISRAIRDQAFPGCQVLLARNGRIIFNRSYGNHTYNEHPVSNDDLYDLASITKIAATTLGVMKAYEMGLIALEGRVGEYLPELRDGNVGHITIERLLTHRSGVQPHLPVLSYMLYRDSTNTQCDSFFCDQPSDKYSIPVAREFYFANRYQDSILLRFNEVDVESGRRYRYSDVNFVLLQKILEAKTGVPLDEWVNEHFYRPLDLKTMTFRPFEKFGIDRIVPTEYDTRWRHQLIHGYVHDEAAALFGGVSGHAGLFSNAEDLATLMQMIVNKGTYAGRQFLKPATIRKFTEAKYGNHRGLGFDKPIRGYGRNHAKYMSNFSFGHLGFTGTCVWVDPREELVYVFLSNRIHPSADNKELMQAGIRGKVHQVVYDALDTYSEEWPDLPDPLMPYAGQAISQVVTD